MLRRLRPWLVVLGLGLLALLWGLAALQGMILDERDEARTRIESQAAGLEEYALRTLELRLDALLGEVRSELEAARDDPLLPGDHFVLVEGGRRMLPRSIGVAVKGTGARELYEALRGGDPIDVDPGTPWGERVAKFTAFRQAVAAGDATAASETFRALGRHRSQFVLDSRRDLPARVAALDVLVSGFSAADGPRPPPKLMADLLHHGLKEGDTVVIEGLQRALLARRARFSVEDFAFLAARVDTLSVDAEVAVDAFHARVSEGVSTAEIPAELDEPSLLGSGSIYARPEPPGRLLGRRVDLAEVVPEIEEDMRRRGQLQDDDRLQPPTVGAEPTRLSALRIELHAPRFAAAIAETDQRFVLKTTFVATCAVLALIIVALGVAMQSRKQRFVELKSGFVSTVSHELRTPLASIRLMAETLERRTKNVPGTRDYPARIVREIDDLSFLVENLLSFNRLDKGRWKPRREDVALSELIDTLEDDLRGVGTREVALVADGVADTVVHADPELLRLLLRNLGKNACLYNQRDPVRLEVRAQTRGSRWMLEVADNGVGIPPAEHGRIFGDFYRAPGTRARGSGLGLAICRHIMEAHDGTIEIAASSPQGTTFALSFPATIVADA